MRWTFLLGALALAACTPPPAKKLAADTRVVMSEPASAAAELKITSPRPGARLKSGFVAAGIAPGTWYFEAVFPIKLVDENGATLAEVPGQAQGDWMTTEPVAFKSIVNFTVAAEKKAWLVLAKDNPSDEEKNAAEVRIPVILTP